MDLCDTSLRSSGLLSAHSVFVFTSFGPGYMRSPPRFPIKVPFAGLADTIFPAHNVVVSMMTSCPTGEPPLNFWARDGVVFLTARVAV